MCMVLCGCQQASAYDMLSFHQHVLDKSFAVPHIHSVDVHCHCNFLELPTGWWNFWMSLAACQTLSVHFGKGMCPLEVLGGQFCIL